MQGGRGPEQLQQQRPLAGGGGGVQTRQSSIDGKALTAARKGDEQQYVVGESLCD